MPQDSRILAPNSGVPPRVPRSASSSRSFLLRPTPPFRLDLTAWTLRRRPENILDRWDGQTYRRALSIETNAGSRIVEIAVEQTGPPAHPRLRVNLETPQSTVEIEPAVRSALDRMLGLSVDLRDFYSFAAKHKQFRALIAGFTGFKPPRYPTVFEALLNAISCQQVSLNVGIMLLNRLVENFGRAASANPSVHACSPGPARRGERACPSPADLASLSTGTLRALGYSQNKERAIFELSRTVASGELDLESLSYLSDADALEKLLSIRGVGRWSAEYALLRGLGRLNIFPGDDVGGWNNLQKHLRLRSRPDYDKTRKLLGPWKKYTGLIYFHFLLDGLRARGLLDMSLQLNT
jgi:DNA-3-methyladenine glycosylase II